MEDVFFELIQVALGTRDSLSRVPNEQEWKELSTLCQKQAISGIIFQALYSLSTCGQKPPLAVLYEWIGYAQIIESRNRVLNERCVEIGLEFKKEGFETYILKGQGNAVMYPRPLLRTPGDIDVYVLQKSLKDIVRYVKKKNPEGRVLYHHIDMGNYRGVEVEVHYRPTFMFTPVHNCRLQKWFKVHSEGVLVELPEEVGRIPVPNWEFNIVFQLSHVYNHLLHEGIGLRQIIDYYYLLRAENVKIIEFKNVKETLKYLGLEKIAGAMMWVLNEVLGLPKDYLIAPKDEKRGKVLLAEIMKGGNFGHCDGENIKSGSTIKKNIQRIRRDVRMVRYFPSESLWEPVFRVYHFLWRIMYN